MLNREKAVGDQTAVLVSGSCEAEAKPAAAPGQVQLAWKDKYFNKAKEAMEKATIVQEYPIEEVKCREEAPRAKLCNTSAKKAAQEKMEKYDLESSALKLQVKDLTEKYESVKTAAQALEQEARLLRQDKTQMEQKYLIELKRFEEAHEGVKLQKMKSWQQIIS